MIAQAVTYDSTVAARWITVQKAAKEAGVHEQTVWRYLRLGLLARRKTVPGLPRRTLVDVNQLLTLRDNPPAE